MSLVNSIPVWERWRIARRVATTLTADWPASRSLRLVDALRSGKGLDAAARRVGATKEDALARWNILIPASYREGLENQAGLAAELRAAAEREVASADVG